MAAPNIVSLTTMTGKTAVAALTTATANVIVSGTNTVSKLNNVIVSNYTSSSITANVMINRSSAVYYVGGNIIVPAGSSLVLLAKDTAVYLEEGDVLQANVSANTASTIIASYEIIS
jgi:hypothetical protein